MNYVGHLAETVYVTVKELYQGLNPATLSGGIDVLVVKQPDGSFRCSPFHVRFGKLGVLRSREKVVDIEINGEPVDLQMKLGDNGEAFFVQELESSEELPSRLCTSPIPQGNPSIVLPDSLLDHIEEDHRQSLNLRKKKRRRKKAKTATPDTSSEELNGMESELFLEKRKTTELSNVYSENDIFAQFNDSNHHSDGEYKVRRSVSSGYLTAFKSDSELELRPADHNVMRTESHMRWSWGRLPQVAEKCEHEQSRALDNNKSTTPFQVEESKSQLSLDSLVKFQHVFRDTEDIFDSSLLQCQTSSQATNPSDVAEFYPMPRQREATQDSPSKHIKEKKGKNNQEMGSSSDFIMLDKGRTIQETSNPSGQRKENKGKNGILRKSQHLGPSDSYFEDHPSLDSSNVVIYLPESDAGLQVEHQNSEASTFRARVIGDISMDSLSDAVLDQGNDIKLSLCGGLAENRDISAEKFTKYAVSYNDLTYNPGILDDPNLVVKIGRKHYNWAVAGPMILSLQAFQKSLPKSTIDKLVKEKMPKKAGRWWFWRRNDLTVEEDEVEEDESEMAASTSREQTAPQGQKTDALSSEEDSLSSPVIVDVPSLPPQSHVSNFKKSLRLSSDQIRDLNLKEGANDVLFSVTTQYQGTCRCQANIYLWNWYDKVVISDIDGTITRSDALGHILPQLGKNWTHHGIIKLYHKIHLNGYKFLYCSARTIGMADLTKGYLRRLSEQGCALPRGPILLTPSSLFSALHREVFEKNPEVFKVACLTDIQSLFQPHGNPFFAGFGNRSSDIYAYLQVELPKSRIFTVNPQGELIQELIKNHKTTYDRLSETVELIFPPRNLGPRVQLTNPEYSQFCFWRTPLCEVNLADLD